MAPTAALAAKGTIARATAHNGAADYQQNYNDHSDDGDAAKLATMAMSNDAVHEQDQGGHEPQEGGPGS